LIDEKRHPRPGKQNAFKNKTNKRIEYLAIETGPTALVLGLGVTLDTKGGERSFAAGA